KRALSPRRDGGVPLLTSLTAALPTRSVQVMNRSSSQEPTPSIRVSERDLDQSTKDGEVEWGILTQSGGRAATSDASLGPFGSIGPLGRLIISRNGGQS